MLSLWEHIKVILYMRNLDKMYKVQWPEMMLQSLKILEKNRQTRKYEAGQRKDMQNNGSGINDDKSIMKFYILVESEWWIKRNNGPSIGAARGEHGERSPPPRNWKKLL